jgi:N-6 DNA methylase
LPKWLSLFKNGDAEAGLSAKKYVKTDDEWLCEAYMKTDYSKIREEDFQKTINDYASYLVKNGKFPKLLPKNSQTQNLNITKWKDFKVGELFKIKRGGRIVRNEDYFDEQNDEYKYPVITTTTMNNGVDGFYNDKNCDGNCIISAGEASGMFSTYQEDSFWALDTVRIYTPIGFSMNRYIGMFLATLLTYNMYRFSYGRKAKPSNMESLDIKLPIAENGKPDWKFMENYIKALPYGDKI